MAPIGFIGLGIMGEGMASRLLSQGVAGTADAPLVVWNRTPSKCADLQARFPDHRIDVAESAADVVARCQVTFSVLSTPAASRAVFEGAAGTLAGVAEGKIVVDCATLAADDMQRMEQQVNDKGGEIGVRSRWHASPLPRLDRDRERPASGAERLCFASDKGRCTDRTMQHGRHAFCPFRHHLMWMKGFLTYLWQEQIALRLRLSGDLPPATKTQRATLLPVSKVI